MKVSDNDRSLRTAATPVSNRDPPSCSRVTRPMRWREWNKCVARVSHLSQELLTTKENPMSDDLSMRQPEEPTQINVYEEWELTYWTKLLGTTEGNLRDAVKAVGPKTDAVRTHLGKRQTQS